jgi:flagellar basal-body rod modification protein FlgD
MDTVSSVSALSTGTQAGTAAAQLASNFDNFLKLLTTQMSHQDPLSPLDATQFTTQLAQFSMVEQQINTNKQLSALVGAQGVNQGSGSVNFLGKMVEAQGATSQLKNGSAEWNYILKGPAAGTQIQILNSAGEVVRLLGGESTAGVHNLEWDGTNNDGEQLEDGIYTIQVSAVDGAGEPVSVATSAVAEVTGVSFENGQVVLHTAVGNVALGDIISVRQPSDPASEA